MRLYSPHPNPLQRRGSLKDDRATADLLQLQNTNKKPGRQNDDRGKYSVQLMCAMKKILLFLQFGDLHLWLQYGVHFFGNNILCQFEFFCVLYIR